MTTLFYLMTFILVLLNIPIIYNWRIIHENIPHGKEFIIKTRTDLGIPLSIIVSFMTLMWSLIGLLSSNWFIFSSILILIVVNFIIEKIYRNYITSRLILILITLLLLLASLNHFHNFDMDFYMEFKKIIGM